MDRGIRINPISQRILAVLDNSLGSLVAIVSGTSLTWGDRGVIDELEKVLSVAGNNGELFAVFAESIELVGVCCLELLASDVRELSFSDERLSFSADELLLEDNDLGGVGLLVFELSYLVGDLLFAFNM